MIKYRDIRIINNEIKKINNWSDRFVAEHMMETSIKKLKHYFGDTKEEDIKKFLINIGISKKENLEYNLIEVFQKDKIFFKNIIIKKHLCGQIFTACIHFLFQMS